MTGRASGSEEKAVAALIAAVAMDGDEPATTVQLFPMGRAVPNDGRAPWFLEDRAHAEAVIAATQDYLGGRDLMFDYDHQAERCAETGGQAPASGWASPSDLFVQDDGIWVRNVRWTPDAAASLAKRAYRYISPWFGYEKATRRLTRFFNAALTNTPAFELAAVAAQSHGDDKPMKAIASALGLAEDAAEDAILAAIKAMQTSATAIATALGLPATATAEEVATAATKAKAGEVDKTKFVPIEDLAAANARLDALERKGAEELVDAAIAATKITPANRDYYIDQCLKDPEAFAKAMGNHPAVLKPGAGGAEGKVQIDALNAEQKALCASMNWDEAEYLAQLQAEAGKGDE